jgi:hypothetical protein
MGKVTYVVRVLLSERQTRGSEGTLIECFRYAGLVGNVKDIEDGTVFDIYPPKGVDSKTWSEMNAQRMQSFSIAAKSAPKGT